MQIKYYVNSVFTVSSQFIEIIKVYEGIRSRQFLFINPEKYKKTTAEPIMNFYHFCQLKYLDRIYVPNDTYWKQIFCNKKR